MQFHRVTLDDYQGSLDLLVQLVRRSEIPVESLAMREITSQITGMLDPDEGKIDEGAELLGPAASLLLLKSRSLLPEEEAVIQENDPSRSAAEVMHRVVDYCRFRDAAAGLMEREEEHAGRLRAPDAQTVPLPPRTSGVSHLALQDLVELVESALKRVKKEEPTCIEEEVWQVESALAKLRSDLQNSDTISLTHYFNADRERGEMIVLFLAILELMKLGELRLIGGAIAA